MASPPVKKAPKSEFSKDLRDGMWLKGQAEIPPDALERQRKPPPKRPKPFQFKRGGGIVPGIGDGGGDS